MRFYSVLGLICVGLISYCQTETAAQEITQLITPPGQSKIQDPASYGLGYEFGANIAAGGLIPADINQAELLAGLLDALAGKEPALQPKAVQDAMQALAQKVGERKKQASEKFIEENKKKEGVQTTQSGLQYIVLKSGNGASPTADSTVTVHYEGRFINGDIFDSSLERGPATFPVGQVIPGWTEALMRMKVGDKWKICLPIELAYGPNGKPPVIGPNEALVFEVELLEVK